MFSTVFNAQNYMEVLPVINEYRDDVLAYGFFDSDDLNSANLIGNSCDEYQKLSEYQRSRNDKMIIKALLDSDVILALVGHVPTFVSLNEREAIKECAYFFPPDYVVGSEIVIETMEEGNGEDGNGEEGNGEEGEGGEEEKDEEEEKEEKEEKEDSNSVKEDDTGD